MNTNVLSTSHVPDQSSSPGWSEVPGDVSVSLGSHVTFKCRTFLQHTETIWLQNGQLISSQNSTKKVISPDNITITYGPVEVEDNGISIGCEVKTTYGLLPSHVGKIAVHCKHKFLSITFGITLLLSDTVIPGL